MGLKRVAVKCVKYTQNKIMAMTNDVYYGDIKCIKNDTSIR